MNVAPFRAKVQEDLARLRMELRARELDRQLHRLKARGRDDGAN